MNGYIAREDYYGDPLIFPSIEYVLSFINRDTYPINRVDDLINTMSPEHKKIGYIVTCQGYSTARNFHLLAYGEREKRILDNLIMTLKRALISTSEAQKVVIYTNKKQYILTLYKDKTNGTVY